MADLHVGPTATARRRDLARIQLSGDGVVAQMPGSQVGDEAASGSGVHDVSPGAERLTCYNTVYIPILKRGADGAWVRAAILSSQLKAPYRVTSQRSAQLVG